MRKIIARWESRGGKHWAELYHNPYGYTYRGNDCGGNLGNVTESAAIATMEDLVVSGYFLPDSAKLPMIRRK